MSGETAKKKILLVDDEPDTLKLTTFRLRKAGYDVLQEINGLQAIERAKSDAPALILLDLNIPGRNGEEVCRILKGDPTTKSIPIVILSASSEIIEQKAAAAGADGFIVKPYDLPDFLAKVQGFIGPGVT